MTTAVIKLTPNEERIRGLLLNVAASIEASRSAAGSNEQGAPSPEPITLRWAGGWVRDKLLGIETHDIDVAINCMTGEAFGLELGQFCKNPSAAGIPEGLDLGSLHTIKANPEKSKNLATATCRVSGADLDFVNLRKETYADDSRNPQVEFGTAAEDASRRDATINALFYNLHTGEVEDFVGGIPDLRAGLIRTPLEPLQTFTDDPLRVLRLVRFASRLRFKIDPETEKVMSHDRVLKSLRIKISRERVGVEVEKMLRGGHTLSIRVHIYHPHSTANPPGAGNYPEVALALVDRLGLYHAIFTDPTSKEQLGPDISSWKAAYGFLNAGALGDEFAGPIYSRLVQGEEDAYLAWTLAALAPWDGVENPNIGQEKPRLQHVPLVARAAREGIMAPNKLYNMTTESHAHRREILELKRLVCSGAQSRARRDIFGMAIRRWSKKTGNWRLSVVYAILVEAIGELRDWPVESCRGYNALPALECY